MTLSCPPRYKSYIPASLNQSISQRNLLTRLRISNVFKVFLKEFNDKTVLNSSVTKHDLKVKYISTLETLTTHFGCEVYEPKSLSIHENNEVPSGSANEDGARRRLLVSGTCGIKWQVMLPEVTLFFFFAYNLYYRTFSQMDNLIKWQQKKGNYYYYMSHI